MLSQELVWLVWRKRRLWKAHWSLTTTLGFASVAMPRYYFLSRRSSSTVQMWPEVENPISPVTAPISLQLAWSKLLYFSGTNVTGLCILRPYLCTSNLLRDPTTRRKVFDTPKKRWSKIFPEELLPIPWSHIRYHFSHVKKYPLRLDRTSHCGVNFLNISLCLCGDRKFFSLLFLHPLFDPITFGLTVPNRTTEITFTCAHIKPTISTR